MTGYVPLSEVGVERETFVCTHSNDLQGVMQGLMGIEGGRVTFCLHVAMYEGKY